MTEAAQDRSCRRCTHLEAQPQLGALAEQGRLQPGLTHETAVHAVGHDAQHGTCEEACGTSSYSSYSSRQSMACRCQITIQTAAQQRSQHAVHPAHQK